MHLYMSGTPRNDPYQTVENRMNTHRLFSMHGDYEKAVLRWVKDIRSGILDADAYLKAYPQHIDLIKKRDANRRLQQREFGRTIDWDTAEVLEEVCKRLDGRPYPRFILLDSGAFTAWNKGEKTTVDDVKRKYSKFIELADGLFDEIWGINLDVIPGERGRDPTPQELDEAVRVSDINYEILTKEFGNIILPVFHQGESPERLAECVAQVDGKHDYICVSPRNDLAEGLRINWSRDAHGMLKDKWPHIRTHGLATTGNRMVRTVPWYSGDSAAWVQHGGYGMIDIFHDEKHAFGRKPQPHYMNYFVSLENVVWDLFAAVRTRDGRKITGAELGLDASSKMTEIAEAFLAAGVDPDNMPLVGGHLNDEGKHYSTLSEEHQSYVRGRVEALGFPFEVCRWDSRVRNLICMAEFVTFAEWAKTSEKEPAQQYLFGGL
ncbi:queuosine tRNA-ribosyltransferase [Pseudanabaena phage Pan1]|nr:queuosine tRNA-ribosyltransferase [Pseudanabaena phage Pan1]